VFNDPLYNNVLDSSLSNFKIVVKSYYDEILKFIKQSKTTDLTYAHYLKEFNGLKIRVSFGQGTPANIPWISFLRDGQTTSNGIYPVYLYFKEKNLLILAYGKSVTNIPVYNWPLSNPKTINRYFEENNLGAPYDYGDSFVFKTYLLNEIPTKNIIDKDLNEIISFYKSVKLSQATVMLNTMDFNNIYRKEICAIKTKPFLLMAGISGTGKSRMVRTLAYKTCPANLQENNQPGNFKNISVKPNWHDSTELIGYVSRIPSKHYVVTDFIRFIIKAWKNLNTPFFLCLDEMNLAPVEQYFAEYLSKIESRQKNNNRVITDAMISKELFSEFFNDLEISSDVNPELHTQFMNEGVGLPSNLIVIGTVNMDETTHSFSRKVLDRAMTFEKNLKNENGLFDLAEQDENDWTFQDQMESNSFLVNEIKPAEILNRFNEKQLVVDRLNGINGVLKNTPFMIAYRTLDEALMYIYFNSICDNKPVDWFDKAFDEIIMMKVLPRIEGDEIKTAEILGNLETQLASYNSTKSLEKCRLMIERLKSGYTSYWN
jgi:5-methylcytosine-specific restriction protein B